MSLRYPPLPSPLPQCRDHGLAVVHLAYMYVGRQSQLLMTLLTGPFPFILSQLKYSLFGSYVTACMCGCACPRCSRHGDQRTTCRHRLSPRTVWALCGDPIRLPALAAGTLPTALLTSPSLCPMPGMEQCLEHATHAP